MTSKPHFFHFMGRRAPTFPAFPPLQAHAFHLIVGLLVGLGCIYLYWRWTGSLNPDALVFSTLVAGAETLVFLGTCLFFYDIWNEPEALQSKAPRYPNRKDLALAGDGEIAVVIVVATFDESIQLLDATLEAAKRVQVLPGMHKQVILADDGNRKEVAALSRRKQVGYTNRATNRGYKAGNLADVLYRTQSDFLVICDADTQLFPDFILKTIGYFADENVAFVQTPHWFYDIPEGVRLKDLDTKDAGDSTNWWRRMDLGFFKSIKVGKDPFLAGSQLFFDVIQRRRSRHGANFCCGAGSIHRTEAVFESALFELGKTVKQKARESRALQPKTVLHHVDLQPFRYHVSEDIFTSLQQHAKGWRSVYHPEPLAQMMSPWTMEAWAAQKLKYAGGTFDIFLRNGLLFRKGLPWSTRLHYLATFWSYLSVLWLPILVCAPMYSLLTGQTPVDAYSLTFFAHLLPVLLLNEVAMAVGCKGHEIYSGRIVTLATLPLQVRAFVSVLFGRTPKFRPTPKDPHLPGGLRHAVPMLLVLFAIVGCSIFGVAQWRLGSVDHSLSMLIVNLFWLTISGFAFARMASAAFWKPRLPNGQLLTPADIQEMT